MKKVYTYLVGTCLLLATGCDVQSQAQLGNILKQIPTTANPSSTEIALGIKQALELGTAAGADKLSAKDGFLGNMAVRIAFPEEARKVESTLRTLGLGSLADNVVTSLNRAAEDAAKEAKPIFTSAIKQMTLTDATNILLGNQDAATNYFKRVTTAQLMEKFKPVVTSSLNKVGATKYWTDAATKYNTIPLVKSVNPDLSEYVAQKAIEGMFIQIAQEELQIRTNINSRSTTLLQKVFGYADRNK
jgi:putative intracellular protease/amidase